MMILKEIKFIWFIRNLADDPGTDVFLNTFQFNIGVEE